MRVSRGEKREEEEEQRQDERRTPSLSSQTEMRVSRGERREEEEEQREDERRRPSLSSQTEIRVSRGERREDDEAVERRRPSLSRQTETRVSVSQDQKSSVRLPNNESRSQQQVASSSRLSKQNLIPHHRRSGEDSNINLNVMTHAGNAGSNDRAYDPYKKYGNITVTRDITRGSNRKKMESNQDNHVVSSQLIEVINASGSKDNTMLTKAKQYDASQYRGDSESKSGSNNEKIKSFSPRKKKLTKRINSKIAQELSDAAKAVPKGSQGAFKVLNREEKNLGPTVHRIPWVPCKVILNCSWNVYVNAEISISFYFLLSFLLHQLNLFGKRIHSCSAIFPFECEGMHSK